MRLKNIAATPHPYGNRIDLKWINSDPDQYAGVKLVRRERTYPASPEDGFLVAEGEGLDNAVDENIKGETVYYYTLFPFKGDPPDYEFDSHNRISAMAISPFNNAGQMYDLLPAIYHRYDKILPKSDEVLERDQHKGQLRRFLDLPGSQLDQIYSFARAVLDLHDIDKVDARLLPLLAQWIGWKTDYSLEIETQRNEVRNAPPLYKTIGIIPTAEATVKRISGWESRTKEFVHNVFVSNRPERMNIWERQRSSSGEWSEPAGPLSLDYAYEGRPAEVRDGDGTLWLFYHSSKKYYDTKKKKWKEMLDIRFKTFDQTEGWRQSRPLVSNRLVNKHPSAVFYDGTLWLFWNVYSETEKRWQIYFRKHTDTGWSAIFLFTEAGDESKLPIATVDNDGIWLFWLELSGVGWQMKYSRYDGINWSPSVIFPSDGGDNPRVEADPYVLLRTSPADSRIWVFWARQEPTGETDQTRWTLVYRVKDNTNPDATGWSSVQSLSTLPPGYHDREPAAFVNADGNIELFWSSNRNGSWSIWQCILDVAADVWGAEEQVVENLYSQRNPLPLLINDVTLIIYRSNESLSYASKVYGATETVDFRYAGSTTSDIQNAEKIALRGEFEDFQTYTYDAGKDGKRANEDWYARDTIGLYLKPNTMDTEKINAGISRIAKVLGEFIPVTDRAVFVTQPDLHTEYVYSYDLSLTGESQFITESYQDTLTSELNELIPVPEDNFSDEIS